MEDDGVNIIEERRKQLQDKLRESDQRIRSLENRIDQLGKEKEKEIKNRTKIMDSLQCDAILKIRGSAHQMRCKLEIGHDGGHRFSQNGTWFIMVEHPDETVSKEAEKSA